MMILAAIALALQAAPAAPAPAVTPAPEVHPAVNAAGQAWAQCTRRVVDGGIGSTRTDAELAADAFAGCAAQATALRAAVAQHIGADAVEPFMTSVSEDARVTILHYLRRTRQPR
ncbi:MAG TPA: hypothetical protein VES64_00990 [Allosphingosinicella sp.]|nr:hypothetical protein [Allosphingosinicella sp.]